VTKVTTEFEVITDKEIFIRNVLIYACVTPGMCLVIHEM